MTDLLPRRPEVSAITVRRICAPDGERCVGALVALLRRNGLGTLQEPALLDSSGMEARPKAA